MVMAAGNMTAAPKPSIAGDKWAATVAQAQAAAKKEKPHAGDKKDPKKAEKFTKIEVISGSTWDTFCPPPASSFKGKIVPRLLNRYAKRRKISIEVHKVTPLTKEVDGKGNFISAEPYEECVIRTLAPIDKQRNLEFRREAFSKIRHHEGNSEDFGAVDDCDDDVTVADDQHGKKAGQIIADTGGKHYDGWKPLYRFPCSAVTVESQHKNSVHLLIRLYDLTQEREFIFDTVEDANKFCEKLDEERKDEVTRAKLRLDATLGGIKLTPFERITLLVEIVSGWDLPVGDLTTSDPFVVCLLGRREIHRTKHISGTLDPIWTVKDGSLFLLEVESEQLFIQDGLKFIVKDFDQFGANDTLGIVQVNPTLLYQAKGERMEFKLQPVPGKTSDEVPGYLAIRCRRATAYDKNFMEGLETSMKGISVPKAPKVSNNAIKSFISRTTKVEDGIKKFKARPGPDPKRHEETEWMTKEQVKEEVMKPSHSWIDSGTGKFGRVFLEILSAEGLPNMDAGSYLGNLTDAFVSVVYEDTFLRTDTIDDCLNPVWLPWTKRAFILNIGHASSQIFLGVFDFDAGFDDHDLIGRVSIDITNLRPNTEYLLTYNIYPSAIVPGRDIQGKINVRMRLEIPDERKLALSVLDPPKPVYVNVNRRKDFRVVRRTCLGKVDVDRYSVGVIKLYVDELYEYQHVLMYIEDAAMTLLLWRGHFGIQLFGKEFLLPIHSLVAFILAVLLVENPELYPSFCFACIAWVLIAVMGWRQEHPDVWSRCHSFAEVLEKVIVGRCSTKPHDIKPFYRFEDAKSALEKWMKRIKDVEERAQREEMEAAKEEAEHLKEMEEIGDADADMSTKVGGGLSIDPFKSTLYPIQCLLAQCCGVLRFVKNIVSWEEAYFSFWITVGSTFLAIVCAFVPWFFLIRWTARIIVWVVFGPWMKLVDVFYVSKLMPETEEERIQRKQQEKQQRKLATAEAINQARQIRENAAKMRDMKKVMFGKFAMGVPIIKQDRYCDIPLPQSSAKPYKQKALTLAELAMQEAGYNRTRLPGQTLVGDMIPRVESETLTSAPTGKPTASPQKLSRNTPGGGTQGKSESTATAYLHIGTIVTLAGVVTFFGVPILASYSDFIVQKLHGE